VDVKFQVDGLAPAVVQDARTGVVLMLGWMNAEALEKTQSTRQVHFYSRSRQKLWRKGETSGNTLTLHSLKIDCDSDTILVQAIPKGPTCHTGTTSCFAETTGGALEQVERQLIERQEGPPDTKSYSQSLWNAGMDAIAEKIREEEEELVEALGAGSAAQVTHEAADLLFHVLVGLRVRNVSLKDVQEELFRRLGMSGIEEKARR
jgi:phosphoribosyl-ATP pyrophosphohydrolase/phosphoribosyl-AMP cyclohydrolase